MQRMMKIQRVMRIKIISQMFVIYAINYALCVLMTMRRIFFICYYLVCWADFASGYSTQQLKHRIGLLSKRAEDRYVMVLADSSGTVDVGL
jgi:hypothetical protein